ncbi:MAG: acetyl-CoA carboxylase biotin carboxyl carrier protein [Waddliaceae bacterium]
MDLRQVKELMIAMGRTGTKRLRIKQEEFEIELEHESPAETKLLQPQAASAEVPEDRAHAIPPSTARTKTADIPASLQSPVEHPEGATADQNGQFVTSPMVGTFYVSPGPDEPAFVKVGDRIEKDTIVCIIEAMKVMNEVKAGVEGTLKEMYVENSCPVEFGTKLFRIS